jgi:selenocysteine lyase/cysteine desulfurase
MGNLSRRELVAAASGVFALRDDSLGIISRITSESQPDPTDEAYWGKLRSAFSIHPTLTVFNHVGINPPPKTVEEAMFRESRRAASDPSYVIWRQQDRELDPVVKDLADIVGCQASELALVPNATFGLHTVISGCPMKAGDAVLLTSEEYSRAFTAAEQRSRREKTVTKTVDFKGQVVSDDQMVTAIVDALTPETKLLVLSEITFMLGRRPPVERIFSELSKRDIPLLLDSSQSIGLLDKHGPFSMMAACLHKWMMGPVGTGILVMKDPWIERVWPLHPASADLTRSIDKFRQIGTHPAAPFLALKECIEMHHLIGASSKASRLQHLRLLIAKGLEESPKVKILSNLDTKVCMPFLTLKIEGLSAGSLAGKLMTDFKIHVTTATRGGIDGIRISPNIFTNLEEIDKLTFALRQLAK